MLSALFTAALLAPLATAHSWVEEMQVISDNGSYTGAPGYSRGYVSRTDPTFNGFSLMWMLPSLEARNEDGTARTRIDDTDSVCHPAQRTSNYTAAFPKLKVSPGDYVAMKYLENGHTTLPWNITGKPASGGTVFVFGTTQPSDDEKIADVLEWNKEGNGGNGKGFLMTAQNFDDGRCHQINCGSISQQRQMLEPNHVAGQPTSTVESWCETDLKIPDTVSAGTLTTYWVWQWPTNPNEDCNTPAGKDEYYTTCADFDVVDKQAAAASNNKAAAPVDQAQPATPAANPQSVAVKDYKSRAAHTPAPAMILAQNNKVVGNVAPVDSAFVSSCSVQASVISANTLGLWPEVFVPNSCTVVSTFGTEAASAAAKIFDSAAASYTSGANAAWSAAFQAANIPMPSRKPWDANVPTETAVSSPAAAPTVYANSTSSATSSPAPTSSSSSAATISSASSPNQGSVTTITTIVILTSTLSSGEIAPTEPTSSSSAPPASSSSSPFSQIPPYPSLSIPTISTIQGTAPARSSSSSPPAAPPNGTKIYRRALKSPPPPPTQQQHQQRAHARNFFLNL